MGRPIQIEVEMPDDLARFRLPASVQRRLRHLLDIQDQGQRLSKSERQEAEAMVNMADLLTLLKLRSSRPNGE
jgi:hypothetical protein